MYLCRIREGQAIDLREMGSAFYMLCPRYSGPLIPTAPCSYKAMGKPLPLLLQKKTLSTQYELILSESILRL